MTNLENTIDRLQELIENGSEEQLREELNSYHSADLADIFQQLKPEERLNCITKRHVTKHELTSNSISFSVAAENSDP